MRINRFLLTLIFLGCSVAANAASDPPWVRFVGDAANQASYYVRLFNGDVQCASFDGRNCVTSHVISLDGVNGSPLLYSANALTCGAQHQRVWGTDGYSVRGHWCAKAYARLYATWRNANNMDPSYHLLYAINPNGDVMCMSFNGADCHWGGDLVIVNHLNAANPLTCGSSHASIWGTDGYNNPNHWCAKLRQFDSTR